MLLSAGNDTTSHAIMVGIYQILRNPKVYEKLNRELSMSFLSLHDDITYEKAKTLTYLVRKVLYPFEKHW
jgi:cytochrome P450